MKKLIVIIGALALLANFLFGSLISIYDDFNIGLNYGVIIINTVLLYLTATMKLKDGYKISLSSLFAFMAVVEYIVCLFAPTEVENNVVLIAGVIILFLEMLILTCASILTNKTM